MKTRFDVSGKFHKGFLGHDKQGHWWLACPLDDRWQVGRCDKYRFFYEADMTPLELEDFTKANGIGWIDEGNGVFWYSHDMAAHRAACGAD